MISTGGRAVSAPMEGASAAAHEPQGLRHAWRSSPPPLDISTMSLAPSRLTHIPEAPFGGAPFRDSYGPVGRWTPTAAHLWRRPTKPIRAFDPLGLVNLGRLMERTSGRQELAVALLDGPVALDDADLASENIVTLSRMENAPCHRADTACRHGTFIAGILSGRRGSSAPSISPGCTLLVRPIFAQTGEGELPTASPLEVANAVHESVDAGARVLNLSAAFAMPSIRGERDVQYSLDYAARHGAIVVAAAGNQGVPAGSAITRHPWVIPVAAYGLTGQPLPLSNLGHAIGRRGLGAPGERVISLPAGKEPLPAGGTSVAAPFVSGAIALLWSEFPNASAMQIRCAVLEGVVRRRTSIAPPLLNAWHAYERLQGQVGVES